MTAEARVENPSLQLAPVRALNAYLLGSFMPGVCTCHRCRESGHLEVGYQQAHTFEIAGATYSRRFAKTADTDVMGALEAGWKSYFKTTMRTTGVVDLAAIHEFTDEVARPFLAALLEGAQCAHERDGELVFGQGPRKPAVKPVAPPAARLTTVPVSDVPESVAADPALAPAADEAEEWLEAWIAPASAPAPVEPEPESVAKHVTHSDVACEPPKPMDMAADTPPRASWGAVKPMQTTLNLFDDI